MKKERIRPTDYTQRERPKTRLAQFFDIFKNRFVELLKLSLLQTVFNLPLLAVIFLFWLFIRQDGLTTQRVMGIFFIAAGALVICLMSSFVGLTGSFYALKKLAYAEGEYASSSFFIGMREEWKRGLLIGFIAGLSVGIALLGLFYFLIFPSDIYDWLKGFGIAIVIIQLIVVLVVCYYSLAQVVVYTNTLRNMIKNSIIMGLIRFPINLGAIILYPGGFIALVCIMPITMYVGLGLMLLTAAFGHLLWMMVTMAEFDKFINKEKFPDYYRKGLYQEETKEE